MTCGNLSLPQCSKSSGTQKTLPQPSCNTLHELSTTHSNYNGPFINSSQTIMPASLLHHKHTKGLADLSRTRPVPDTLDWRIKGDDKIENGTRNQEDCGCCWAMASSSVLGDRYALTYNKKAPYPSSAWTIMCLNEQYPGNFQCNCGGNNYVAACNFMTKGTKLEQCFPQKIIGNNAPSCPTFGDDCCFNCCGPEVQDIAKVKFFASKKDLAYLGFSRNDDVSTIDPEETVRAIQYDIYMNGPVLTSFLIPTDWEEWFLKNRGTDEVYQQKNGDNSGGHSVVLVGWGRRDSDDQLYWILRNSWGTGGKTNGGFCNMLASYDPKHHKLQIPQPNWSGLDIPKAMGDSFAGGCVTFLPGDKPDWPGWENSAGPGALPAPVPFWKNLDIHWSLIIYIALILGILIFISIFKKYYKKK